MADDCESLVCLTAWGISVWDDALLTGQWCRIQPYPEAFCPKVPGQVAEAKARKWARRWRTRWGAKHGPTRVRGESPLERLVGRPGTKHGAPKLKK